MSRPVPETGQFETSVIDFGAWKRRALADDLISDQEGKELVFITERMVTTGNRLVRSVGFVIKVLTGQHGMDSICVRRSWEQRQAELVYLDDFRAEDPERA